MFCDTIRNYRIGGISMWPTINGKSFLDCDVSDLQMLIDNPDYRECEWCVCCYGKPNSGRIGFWRETC